jgi:hypothetical protein
MTITPLLLYIWAGLFFLTVGLLVYRGQLTRYENDQLFLHDEDAEIVIRNKIQHDKLLKQLARLRPLVGSTALLGGAVTALVVSLYVHAAWQNTPWHHLAP